MSPGQQPREYDAPTHIMTTNYLSATFDWHLPDLVSAYDEAPLWSAVFGALLLAHVPMRPAATVLDLGCGIGFPTIELAGRLGPKGTVWGIDPWPEALERARAKAQSQAVTNVHFVDGDAAQLPFDDARFDLVTSNLGVNNFDDVATALAEARRVLRPDGRIALTTNLRGHMAEFYGVFERVLQARGATAETGALQHHIDHRATVASLQATLDNAGFVTVKIIEDSYAMRFADGTALLNHYFIKIGFLDAWKAVVPPEEHASVFAQLEAALNADAANGGLMLTIPMAYIEAKAE